VNNSLWKLIAMHLKEFYRDPEILFWTIFLPIATAYILGVAFDDNRRHIQKIAIVRESVSQSNITEWQQKAANLSARESFEFSILSEEEAMQRLRRGRTALVLQSENTGNVVAVFDPGNRESNSTYLALTSLLSSEEKIPIQAITQKGHRYIDFLIPGLIAMGVMNSILWGVGYSIIEFRMKKLLRRLNATPMSRLHFFLSYFVVRNLVTLFEALILLVFGYFSFKHIIQGDLLSLFLFFLAGNFAFSGIALLISSRAGNTRIGNGIINAVTMPMMVLSGIFFSYLNFPESVIPLLDKLPLAVFADGLRMIMNEGADFSIVAGKAVYLVAIGLMSYFAGLKIFRWN